MSRIATPRPAAHSLVRSIAHCRGLVRLYMLAWVSRECRIGPSVQSISTHAAPAA